MFTQQFCLIRPSGRDTIAILDFGSSKRRPEYIQVSSSNTSTESKCPFLYPPNTANCLELISWFNIASKEKIDKVV